MGRLRVHPLLQLQQSIGNRAVARLIQAKLQRREAGQTSRRPVGCSGSRPTNTRSRCPRSMLSPLTNASAETSGMRGRWVSKKQSGFERLAHYRLRRRGGQVARSNGMKRVTINVGRITNPIWRVHLESQGYVRTQTDTGDGGFNIDWIKTIDVR